MNHFIHLTSRVINKLHIVEIVKTQNMYEIHLLNHKTNGAFLWGSGYIDTNSTIIKICQEKDKQDYKTLSVMIDKKAL
jgi:hypothetical protein